jgi:hypothetical protein
METPSVLVDLEFVKSLVVNLDSKLEQSDPDTLVQQLQDARCKIDEVIKTLQYNGGI